jgi:hypothetical protein
MNKRRENCFNINEWEEETGHEDRPNTHARTHTHAQRDAKGIKEKEGWRIKI